MKNKVLLSIFSLMLLFAIVILILNANGIRITDHINVMKYGEFESDGYLLSFHGSFGEIRRVSIKKDGARISKLKLDIPSSLPDELDDMVTVVDIDRDGDDDLLIAVALDGDGDVHRRLFTFDGNEFISAGDYVLSNLSVSEDGITITSEHRERIFTVPSLPEDQSPFEDKNEMTEFIIKDGALIPMLRRSLSYYSETDIYCYSIYTYNNETGSLEYSDEEWLLPAEYERSREMIAEHFRFDLP